MKKILIVEDDLALRYMLQRSLHDLRLDIIAADNGRVALDYLRADPTFALVVADIMMPVLNGLEFRKHQLKDETISHIPVIFLTGHLSHVQSAKELNPHFVLTKPVMPDDFKKVVENIIFK